MLRKIYTLASEVTFGLILAVLCVLGIKDTPRLIWSNNWIFLILLGVLIKDYFEFRTTVYAPFPDYAIKLYTKNLWHRLSLKWKYWTKNIAIVLLCMSVYAGIGNAVDLVKKEIDKVKQAERALNTARKALEISKNLLEENDLLKSDLAAANRTLKLALSLGGQGRFAMPPIADRSLFVDRASWKYLGEFVCTGYNNTVAQCDTTPHITASGRTISLGYSVAIDYKYWGKELRKGALAYVEGVGVVRFDDTGGKIRGRERMDISCATLSQAKAVSGRRRVWLITKEASSRD